ncbi:glutamine synthetase [Tanacetum coccineum]
MWGSWSSSDSFHTRFMLQFMRCNRLLGTGSRRSPQAIFKDPFRRGNNILVHFKNKVMCDAYTPAGEPIPTNKRCAVAKFFSDPKVEKEGPYYWGIGPDKAFGRDVVGPSVGISDGDEVWVARYIIERIVEISGVVVSFYLKPIPVDGDGNFERVSGTSVGGGAFWGLGKLLTKCKSFDALLKMSHDGNNRVIDMLIGTKKRKADEEDPYQNMIMNSLDNIVHALDRNSKASHINLYCQRIGQADFWGGESEILVVSLFHDHPALLDEIDDVKILMEIIKQATRENAMLIHTLADENKAASARHACKRWSVPSIDRSHFNLLQKGDDASYVESFTTKVLMIGPGQTTDVLIKAGHPDTTLMHGLMPVLKVLRLTILLPPLSWNARPPKMLFESPLCRIFQHIATPQLQLPVRLPSLPPDKCDVSRIDEEELLIIRRLHQIWVNLKVCITSRCSLENVETIITYLLVKIIFGERKKLSDHWEKLSVKDNIANSSAVFTRALLTKAAVKYGVKVMIGKVESVAVEGD